MVDMENIEMKEGNTYTKNVINYFSSEILSIFSD
jgi:hypothetical protein